MTTRKYFGEIESPHHSGRLQWPGTPDGFPVLMSANSSNALGGIKQDELDLIEHRFDYKSKLFELWDPAQKNEFDEINDRILNKWYSLCRREDHWDEEHKHYRVWLEWCQVYGVIPPK